MDKKDLIKFALIGMASGACLAAQSFNKFDGSLLAMNKCTKNSQHQRGMDNCADEDNCDSCGGSSGCNGNSRKTSTLKSSGPSESPKTSEASKDSKISATEKNGRKATRAILYGNKSEMKSKREKSNGKYY